MLDRLTRDRIETEEIAIERQNAESLAEAHKRLHTGTQHFLVRTLLAFIADGFVTEKFGLRISSLHFTQQAVQGR